MSTITDTFNSMYRTSLLEQDGKVIQRNSISVPDALLDRNAALRDKTSWRGEETLKVASVPLSLLLTMARTRGCTIEELSNKEIVKELRANNLEYFTTYKGDF